MALMAILPSCRDNVEDDDRMIWDFANYGLEFYVYDKDTGENLMTPDEDGNYNTEIVKVEYNGNIYPISWVGDISKEIKSRYLFPRPLSLGVLTFSWEVDEDAKSIYKFDDYRLSFGEFSPTDNYKEEIFKLLWSDGTTNIFKFDCYIDWAKKNEPVVHNDIYMDGQKLKDWQVEFYK